MVAIAGVTIFVILFVGIAVVIIIVVILVAASGHVLNLKIQKM